MAEQTRFGPAGVPPAFRLLKAKMHDVPGLLREEGLDAFEYQAVRWGAKPQIRKEEAEKLHNFFIQRSTAKSYKVYREAAEFVDSHPVIKELGRVTKPGGTLLIQTLHKGSVQRKLLGLFERSKKFDKMYGMEELQTAFCQCGFEKIEFLKMYHPFTFVTTGSGEKGIGNLFCTSFAIKGRKKIE